MPGTTWFDSIVKQPKTSLRAQAKQSIAARKQWIASSQMLLAMTLRHNFAFSRRDAPELCVDCHPLKEQEGAGKAGCALHPRSRVQKCTKKRTRAYRSSGGNPTFPAQWFTAYFVLSSVTGLSCHRRPQDISRELDASVGASGPHGFAVRVSSRSSLATLRVHCIPPRVRDDRDPPLSSGETRGFKSLICPTAKAEYFSQRGWTGF